MFIEPNAGQVNKSFSSVAIGSSPNKTANGGEIVTIGINGLSLDLSGIWNTAVDSYPLASH